MERQMSQKFEQLKNGLCHSRVNFPLIVSSTLRRALFFSPILEQVDLHSMPEAIANGSNGTMIDDEEIDFTDIEEK
jgi:hypothetical protein